MKLIIHDSPGTCNRMSISTSTPRNTYLYLLLKGNSSHYKLSETYSLGKVSVLLLLVPHPFLALTLLQCKLLRWGSNMASAKPSPPFHTQACLSGRSLLPTALLACRFLQLRPCMVRDQVESGWEEGQLGTVKAPVVKLT